MMSLLKIQIIILVTTISSVVFEKCELDNYEGLVLSKYYRETCPHCQRITPLINEIDERLERHGIEFKVRNVECGKCNCSKDNIDAVPTIVLSKHKVELGRFRGYREYDEIADFISGLLKIDKNILKHRTKVQPGKVVELKKKDFYSGFEGPWIILFYNNKDNDINKLKETFEELGKFYKEKLNVGQINQKEAKKIVSRYGITEFPSIIATYNGIVADYSGQYDLSSLIDFCDNLLSPSFEEVDLQKLNEIVAEAGIGTPIYVVFYSHLGLANSYFRKLAHEVKFRARFVRTNDKALFDKAGIHPKQKDPNSDKNIKDSDAVILTVYRNNIFHRYDSDINESHNLLSWVFHTHYPYITRIDNLNFNTIFLGYKPAMILVTHNDHFIEELEQFSESKHFGLPYTDYVYGILDAKEFSGMIKNWLPKINMPVLVIYDPIKKKFFTENVLLTKENFLESAHKISRKYDENSLEVYPFKSHKIRNGAVIIIILGLVFGVFYQKKKPMAKIE